MDGDPGSDLKPVADVGFQCLDRLVKPAAKHLIRQVSEPALDLVDPGSARGCELELNAGGGVSEPRLDLLSLVRGVVVTDDVHIGGPKSSPEKGARTRQQEHPVGVPACRRGGQSTPERVVQLLPVRRRQEILLETRMVCANQDLSVDAKSEQGENRWIIDAG